MIKQNLFALVVGFSVFIAFWSCATMERPPSHGNSPSHHTPKGYQNPSYPPSRGFGGLLKWQLGLGPHETPPLSPDEIPPYQPVIVKPDLARIKDPPPDPIQLTWIGHSTFLIQMNRINILTDPVFSDRCSPFSFGGVRRVVPPGVRFEDLPPIHAVLISHNHYDHLDEPTVKRLGNRPKYFIPLGVGRWLKKKQVDNLVELDWWQTSSLSGVRFHSVPLRHFSGRNPFDRNRTLWSGWVVEGRRGKVFFAGDTGYSPEFKEIAERFGPLDLSLIPIGSYRPRWFMKPVHVDPPEAIRIHQDTKSRHSVASHWGTFRLSDEPLGEPPLYLKRAKEEAGVDERDFLVMRFGETLLFP